MVIIGKCVYTGFNAPWITQGINVTSPYLYLPLDRYAHAYLPSQPQSFTFP
jgi:hypothetical protein